MPIRTYPKSQMSEAQRIAQEDRQAIRNSIARMSMGYDTRRREDALNYEDDVKFAASRHAGSEVAAAAGGPPAAVPSRAVAAAQSEAQEQTVTETVECDEDETAAPAP